MVDAAWGIKFIQPKHRNRFYVIRDGWLMDPMTEKPKEFDSMITARRYGELSFKIDGAAEGYVRRRSYVPHVVVRLR